MSSDVIVMKSEESPSIYEVGEIEDNHHHNNNGTNPLKNKSSSKIIDESLLQMPYPVALYRKPCETLPSNVAIPVGLAQVMLQLSIVGTIVMCIDVCMYILLRLHEN
jgi:hypothetical protein